MGIEPTSQPWEGRILPMNYTRVSFGIIAQLSEKCNCNRPTFSFLFCIDKCIFLCYNLFNN